MGKKNTAHIKNSFSMDNSIRSINRKWIYSLTSEKLRKWTKYRNNALQDTLLRGKRTVISKRATINSVSATVQVIAYEEGTH